MSQRQLVDRGLVRRAQRGDSDAAAELAATVTPLVRRHAARLLGDPERAQDIAQVALMKAFSRLGDVRAPEAFYAWLLRITRNECLDEIRRPRHPQVPLSELDGAPAAAASASDPEEELVVAGIGALVRRVAEGLPEHYRRTLVMRALEDRSYEEVGAELGISTTVARLWYHRARKRFRAGFVASIVDRPALPRVCQTMGASIAELIEGTLGREDRDRVQGHLVACHGCRQTEDELRNTAFRTPSRGLLLGLGAVGLPTHVGRIVLRHAHRALGAARPALLAAGGGAAAIAGAGTLAPATADAARSPAPLLSPAPAAVLAVHPGISVPRSGGAAGDRLDIERLATELPSTAATAAVALPTTTSGSSAAQPAATLPDTAAAVAEQGVDLIEGVANRLRAALGSGPSPSLTMVLPESASVVQLAPVLVTTPSTVAAPTGTLSLTPLRLPSSSSLPFLH